MHYECPRCHCSSRTSDSRILIRHGTYRRTSDKRIVQRFFCKKCELYFSRASFDPCFKQLKRGLNTPVYEQLASGVSMRRTAYLLKTNRKTVKRKFIFMGLRSMEALRAHNQAYPKAKSVQFDDMETIEHTKCKPLSITLAVEEKTRRVLGFSVSRMPAKGRLAKISVRRYGYRTDERPLGREKLFLELQDLVDPGAVFKSDQNPHYPEDVKRFFPKAQHIAYKGKRGAAIGQGELKKVVYDPLFSLNHTCAKMRDDIKRLVRRNWCTTKRPDRLVLHIAIMALYHNRHLIGKKRV